MIATGTISINGREYRLPPRPVAVICIDGCANEYLDQGIARGLMPNMARLTSEGFRGMARGALPSFTNVNNAAIVTGAPPRVHGLPGNFFLDPETGEEVMMNSSKYLRAETILAAASKAGRKVAFITAKNKLLELLSAGMEGIAFSSEKAREATMERNGIADVEKLVGPTPEIYSGDASVYVLKAGVSLVENQLADFLYLSLTDFMQHTYAPEASESLEFYRDIDTEIGRLMNLGVIVGGTADHGMNGKTLPDGSPNVIYLETRLCEKFGDGFKVILPITDPYVKHHGALGSFGAVHVPAALEGRISEVMDFIWSLPGVTEVLEKSRAVDLLELPADRTGDIVVMSGRNVVLGRTPAHHDLSQLDAPLRSHGGRYEEMVPIFTSLPLNGDYQSRVQGDVRNFDVFDLTLNGVQL